MFATPPYARQSRAALAQTLHFQPSSAVLNYDGVIHPERRPKRALSAKKFLEMCG
jgi:hypothetical protein